MRLGERSKEQVERRRSLPANSSSLPKRRGRPGRGAQKCAQRRGAPNCTLERKERVTAPWSKGAHNCALYERLGGEKKKRNAKLHPGGQELSGFLAQLSSRG